MLIVYEYFNKYVIVVPLPKKIYGNSTEALIKYLLHIRDATQPVQ